MKISASVVIIVSLQDEAGINMKKHLLLEKKFDDEQPISLGASLKLDLHYTQFSSDKALCILTVPGSQVETDYLAEYLNANLVIFASKHMAKTGKKALLAHPLGNWGQNLVEKSGVPRSLGIAPGYALYQAFHAIRKYKEMLGADEFWVGFEVSHHGPTKLNIPAIFMETGGTIEEWKDQNATKIIALAILNVATYYVNHSFNESLVTYVGIGGGHYAPGFIKRVEKKLIMVGHMVPKYHSKNLDEKMIKLAYEKTVGKQKKFLLDKKGLSGKERVRIIKIIEKLGYNYSLTTEISTKGK